VYPLFPAFLPCKAPSFTQKPDLQCGFAANTPLRFATNRNDIENNIASR
jgi:hypothetical protein